MNRLQFPEPNPDVVQRNMANELMQGGLIAMVAGAVVMLIGLVLLVGQRLDKKKKSAAAMLPWAVRTSAGREIGPVDEATLRKWIAEGRLRPGDFVRRADWPQWKSTQAMGNFDA